jgi:hydrogenase-4 component B
MPITAISFLIAAISISALPPTNGFLSEWMIFQSMLSSSSIENIALKLAFPFSIFALALTGGLAIACFVKAFGITFLGLHRSENAAHAKEVNSLMQIGQILMALVVISLMLFVPFIIKFINLSTPVLNIYDKIFPNILIMKSVNGNGGSISPLILVFALIIITLAIYFIYKSLNIKERVYHTWACGYEITPKNQYSATGFAGPIRKFFTWLYRPKEHKVTETLIGHKTKFSYSFYEVHVKPLFEESLYNGAVKLANIISFYVYKISHFEKTKYIALIFNLVILVLFSYRVFYHDISWGNVLLEITIIAIFTKILLLGDKK